MLRRSFVRAVAGVAAAVGVALPLQVLSATPANATPANATPANATSANAAPPAIAARILYYDASGAGEFVNVVHQGVANWNASVCHMIRSRTAAAAMQIS